VDRVTNPVPSAWACGIKRPVSEPTPQRPPAATAVPAPPREPTVFTRRHWLAVLAIALLGAAARWLHLGEWSVWIDEAHTWRDATMPLDDFLRTDRALYPLPFLLLRGLIASGFGEDAGSLRLPFVIVGALTVPLVAVCGRRLVGAWPAVLASLLLAVNPWHLYWSQNARGYVFVVLAAVVVADRLHAWVKHDRLLDLFVLCVALIFGAATHSTGGLLALAAVTSLVLRRRRFDRFWLASLAGVAVVAAWTIPWALDHWSPLRGFIASKRDNPSVLHFVQTTAYYFRPMVLTAAVVGLWLLRPIGGRDRAIALGCLVAVPFFVLLAVGGQLVLTTARYAICALPALTWLAAFAAWHFGKAVLASPRLARPAALAVAAALPVLLVAEHAMGLVEYHTSQYGQRARWREAAAFLLERAAGRPVWVSTTNHPTLLYYLRPGQYRNQIPPGFARNRVVPLDTWQWAEGEDEFETKVHEPGVEPHVAWHREQSRERGALFAFVVTAPELAEKDRDGAMREAIARHCRLALQLPCWVGPKDESIQVWFFDEP
jgi:mannosyltransferase